MHFSPSNTYKIKYFNWTKNRTEETELPASQADYPFQLKGNVNLKGNLNEK